jgi:DNA-binding NarL/FixJ family response regulator
MLVAGCSNKEIASPLGIQERTVKAHVAKLLRKVGVQNRIMLSLIKAIIRLFLRRSQHSRRAGT